jgi:hypothetical protein
MTCQRHISTKPKFSAFVPRRLFVVSAAFLIYVVQSSLAFHSPSSPCHLKNFQYDSHLKFTVRRNQLYSSTFGNDDMEEESDEREDLNSNDPSNSFSNNFQDGFLLGLFQRDEYKKLPPLQVEDLNLLFYDIFLIVNLSLSISFWVAHRMSFSDLPAAFNEGCIFSIVWILSGLYHGAFLMSAVDGHYGSMDERAGPKAAAALGLNTYFSAINLRLVFALASAIVHHRQVGLSPVEELIPLELGCGIVLMTLWRALHSYVTPRI